MANILIIDDDKAMGRTLSDIVKRTGHDATCALTLKEGFDEALSEQYDAVFLDVRLPDGNGLEALPEIRKTESSPEVIIITGVGDADAAELAIRNGAWDYVQKPLEAQEVVLALNRVLQYRENSKDDHKLTVALKLEGIVGSSPQMRACIDLLAHAANSNANVLIVGETGTGKELFAQAIHKNSLRAKKNMVVVDCAAIPETLVESSLFGHERGSFTGADRPQEGLIKQADGGTLFLDEVGELPVSLQKAFLRVLQERRFRPIGGKQEVESNFRLAAATNRDLDEMSKTGQFREDLLHRLRSMTIELPPLRQHTEDIKELAMYYTAKICELYGTETKGFSPDFFDALYAYEWPGNVRELMNTLEGTLSGAQHESILFPRHLPTHIRIKVARDSVDKSKKSAPEVGWEEKPTPPKSPGKFGEVRKTALEEVEKNYFQELMRLTTGSIKEACQISGLSRNRLYIYLKRHNISRFGWPSSDNFA